MAKAEHGKTSLKQIRANQRNALKSTGPRTQEGKAAVRHNALTHGLLAKETLLSEEDQKVLAKLGAAVRDRLRPEGELEDLLVDRIVSAVWRLRRAQKIEAGVLEHKRKDFINDIEKYSFMDPVDDENGPEALGLAWIRSIVNTDVLSPLSRYETALERGLYRALHELERLQTRRAGGVVPPPVALDVSVSKGE